MLRNHPPALFGRFSILSATDPYPNDFISDFGRYGIQVVGFKHRADGSIEAAERHQTGLWAHLEVPSAPGSSFSRTMEMAVMDDLRVSIVKAESEAYRHPSRWPNSSLHTFYVLRSLT